MNASSAPNDRRRPVRSLALVIVGVVVAATACSSSHTDAGAASDRRPPAPPSTAATPASATVRQPAQKTAGSGSSDLPHRGWRVSEGGTGADAWFVFEPTAPRPRAAPLAVVMHGYGEFSGYNVLYGLIRHTVLTGSVVIFPRWQTGIATPCPGPVDIEPCMDSAVNGIRGALAFLHAHPRWVQPQLGRTSYLGFSFGGIITANLANRYRTLGLPRPRAIFLDDPHDGALTGTDEPALDDSMRGIPSSVLLECHVGSEGVISEPGLADGSCNSLFPMLRHIPRANKSLVLTHADAHGEPALRSQHGVCSSPRGSADAYDWNFCWKVWDALRSAAYSGADRRYALGDTVRHRDNGRWSDGVPVAPLEIRNSAPIPAMTAVRPATGARRRSRSERVVAAVTCVAVVFLAAWRDGEARNAAHASPAAAACPATVDAAKFATTKTVRGLTARLAGFGLRSPGSTQHRRELAWLEHELRAIPGMKVRSDPYTIDRWQPLPNAPGKTPGRDLARAGGLTVRVGSATRTIPVAGALPFTPPTPARGRSGELVYIPDGQAITAANAKGKVVVLELPATTTPYAVFPAIAHSLTKDFPSTGTYDRPYARPIDPILVDAGRAGAAGVVLLWDAPTAQLRGYWDPHTGTRFRVPAVYVGNDEAATIKRLASRGATAHVVVRAKWDRVTTRNVFGELTGRTRERIVVNSHTDGVTWVQENGSVGVLTLARYLASLPRACRNRDVEFALTSDHLGFTDDGTFRYAESLDRDFDRGTVAFVLSMEHLGTREILPTGAGRRLRFTGHGEPIVWSAPEESPPLVRASVDAVARRHLDRTAVVKGTEAPVADRVPEYCAQGGIGGNFNAHLLPTASTITGPWSLWAPSFGERAVDFHRMRREVLAMGDVARALDSVPRSEIAGSYVAERQRRTQGATTCDILNPPPRVAPGP